MSTIEEEHVYLIMYGAQRRKIKHIGLDRDGVVQPRCNSHYTASHDAGPRLFRPVEGPEQDYATCKRCLAWREWRW